MRVGGGATLLFGIIVGMASAAAQEPDPEEGHRLSSQLCTSCHIVGNESRGSDLAPPFPVIARDPEISLVELHSWDEEAFHPTLRHLSLTAREVADIDAYLDELRGAASLPSSETGTAPEPTLPPAPPDVIGPPIGRDRE